jgi:hypothetical protein
MRHWNLCVPPASGPVLRLSPAGTPVVKKMSPIAHSGTGSSPSSSLISSTHPPPNAATSLNVWNSPPRLEAVIVPQLQMLGSESPRRRLAHGDQLLNELLERDLAVLDARSFVERGVEGLGVTVVEYLDAPVVRLRPRRPSPQ